MQQSSHLSRRVFKALLRNQPYEFTECFRRADRVTPYFSVPIQTHRAQKRSIFGLSRGSAPLALDKAKNTPANLEVALGQMVDVVRARRSQSRPPAPENVADAFKFLFRSHLENPRRFSRNEIFLATETFKHLQEIGIEDGSGALSRLTAGDLYQALQSMALATGREKFRSDTRSLAYMIFESLRGGSSVGAEEALKQDQASSDSSSLETFAEILSRTGSAREARDLLMKSSSAKRPESIPSWIAVFKGLYNEGLEKEAWKLFAEMADSIGVMDPYHHEELVTFLVDAEKPDAMKRMYDRASEAKFTSTLRTRLAVLKYCTHEKDFDWSKPIAQSSLSDVDEPEVFNALLLWHSAQGMRGRKAEETLKSATQSLGVDSNVLTMTNINYLIRYAYSTNNLESVKVLLEVAKRRGLSADGETLLMQLDHHIKMSDLSSAKTTYTQLLSEDKVVDGSDVPVLNRYLTAICFSPNPEIDTVMRLVDSLLDRGADLDAETIAGLCHVFLQRDELDEAVGLLRHRADAYPNADRARVSAVFTNFILDPSVKDQRAFNAYELFRVTFPETSVENRLPLMWSFFNRNRSDLACLVFGHMRQRQDIEGRPTVEAYAQCFEGIAKCRDIDGLNMVKNMLKMDREVEVTTRIHNALMMAYTACQESYTAILDHFWKILDSREGPTLSTFALALRACETWIPQGAYEARRIMALMQSWGVPISKEIYLCYIGALAGQSEFENTVELIEEMARDISEEPDALTIGTFYNAIPWQYRKDEVENWAKQAYPDLWDDLLSYGDEIDEEWEVRYFKIDRTIHIDDGPLFPDGEYDPQIAHNSHLLMEAPTK